MINSDLVTLSANLKDCLSLVNPAESLEMACLYVDLFAIFDKLQVIITNESSSVS